MKTHLPLTALVSLALLAGCSTDYVAGPDLAATAPTSASDAAFRGTPQSLMGAWRAADETGTITLFFEVGATQDFRSGGAQTISGKGIIDDTRRDPLVVAVDGYYRDTDITFTISDPAGRPLLHAAGSTSEDLSMIKVRLRDAADRERILVFERF